LPVYGFFQPNAKEELHPKDIPLKDLVLGARISISEDPSVAFLAMQLRDIYQHKQKHEFMTSPIAKIFERIQ
jgi:hypothetical protein